MRVVVRAVDHGGCWGGGELARRLGVFVTGERCRLRDGWSRGSPRRGVRARIRVGRAAAPGRGRFWAGRGYQGARIGVLTEVDEVAEEDALRDASLAEDGLSLCPEVIRDVTTPASEVESSRRLLIRVCVQSQGAVDLATGGVREHGVGDGNDSAGGCEGGGGGMGELGSHAAVGRPRLGVRGLRRALSFPAALASAHVTGFQSGGVKRPERKKEALVLGNCGTMDLSWRGPDRVVMAVVCRVEVG